MLGFTAPAYTPLVWFFGLSLMFDRFYGGLHYAPVYFLALSTIFLGFHGTHAFLTFLFTASTPVSKD